MIRPQLSPLPHRAANNNQFMNSDTTLTAREFALQIVHKLNDHGFQALWAGGCVRDSLLGKQPSDYDVATNASPDQVIRVFGAGRTLSVGAAFGVIVVLGPKASGLQTEVATFRSDGNYSDGRRPDSVSFCSAEEDAQRRDFTINGMFFDPLAEQVIDYVGGQQDLQTQTLRCIGRAEDRFREDNLRMLRAIRFAATYQFQLDHETQQAICRCAAGIHNVSGERILNELRRMLKHANRQQAFQLLLETGLLPLIIPEFQSLTATNPSAVKDIDSMLGRLESNSFPPAAALLLHPFHNKTNVGPGGPVNGIDRICRGLTMSRKDLDCIVWILDKLAFLVEFSSQPLHVVRPILADPRSEQLLQTATAAAGVLTSSPTAEDISNALSLQQKYTPETLCPAPLVNGDDVQALGICPGPPIRRLLDSVRAAQLDHQITSRESALRLLQQLVTDRNPLN